MPTDRIPQINYGARRAAMNTYRRKLIAKGVYPDGNKMSELMSKFSRKLGYL